MCGRGLTYYRKIQAWQMLVRSNLLWHPIYQYAQGLWKPSDRVPDLIYSDTREIEVVVLSPPSPRRIIKVSESSTVQDVVNRLRKQQPKHDRKGHMSFRGKRVFLFVLTSVYITQGIFQKFVAFKVGRITLIWSVCKGVTGAWLYMKITEALHSIYALYLRFC